MPFPQGTVEMGENGKKMGLMKIHAIISWQVIATILLLGQDNIEMLVAEHGPCKLGLPAALLT